MAQHAEDSKNMKGTEFENILNSLCEELELTRTSRRTIDRCCSRLAGYSMVEKIGVDQPKEETMMQRLDSIRISLSHERSILEEIGKFMSSII